MTKYRGADLHINMVREVKTERQAAVDRYKEQRESFDRAMRAFAAGHIDGDVLTRYRDNLHSVANDLVKVLTKTGEVQ